MIQTNVINVTNILQTPDQSLDQQHHMNTRIYSTSPFCSFTSTKNSGHGTDLWKSSLRDNIQETYSLLDDSEKCWQFRCGYLCDWLWISYLLYVVFLYKFTLFEALFYISCTSLHKPHQSFQLKGYARIFPNVLNFGTICFSHFTFSLPFILHSLVKLCHFWYLLMAQGKYQLHCKIHKPQCSCLVNKFSFFFFNTGPPVCIRATK